MKAQEDEPERNSGTIQNLDGKLLANKYQLLERVGSGGMGIVYRANNVALGTTVSVKILQQQILNTPDALLRLKREAKTLAKLDHPNILRIFSLDRDDSHVFIVTEFIDGQTLGEILTQPGKLDDERIMLLYRQIGQALQYAHSQGVIHRDIKPSNIIVSSTNGAESVKILDFGVARVLDSDTFQRLTRTGALVGTPLYMSPEQCRGEPVDARSDIYSLGCMLYETLSGSPPFSGETPLDVMYKHLNDSVPQLERTRLGLVALKAMEKDPADRFQSGEEFVAALSGPTQSTLVAKRRSTKKLGRRWQLVLTGVLILGTIMAAWFGLKEPNSAQTDSLHRTSHIELLQTFEDAVNNDSLWNWPGIDDQLAELSKRELNDHDKARRLEFEGLRYTYLGKISEANNCFIEALELSHTGSFSSHFALRSLTNNLIKANELPAAIAFAEGELAYVNAHPQLKRNEKINAYQTLSRLYVQNQKSDKAAALQESIASTFTSPGTVAQAAAVAEAGRCYQANHHSDKAFETLNQWERKHLETADLGARGEIAVSRAEIYMDLKNPSAALKVLLPLEQELQENGNIGNEAVQRDKAKVFLDLGAIYLGQGDKRAKSYIEKAQGEASKTENKTFIRMIERKLKKLSSGRPAKIENDDNLN